MKSTAIAPSNIAFIKYWGRKDEKLRLPANGSISMNLSNLMTTTTVEFSSKYKKDVITIDGKKEPKDKSQKIVKHLDRIRKLAGVKEKAKIVSINTFPRSTGLSSSASGFAALTLAASAALGLKLSEKELSILARQGSGSACRSIPDGFVQWLDGDTSDTSYAVSLHPQIYWDIVDVVAILTTEEKDVATSEGQKLAMSSLFYNLRIEHIKDKILWIKKALAERDFKTFGEIVEAEALEMHAIMLTSVPSLIYWYPSTVTVMKLVKKWRSEGLPVYFTINTGQNVHIICEKSNEKKVITLLKKISHVKKVISNASTVGTRVSEDHLF